MKLFLALVAVTFLSASPISAFAKSAAAADAAKCDCNGPEAALCKTADGKPACGPDAYENIYDRTILDKSLSEYFAAINGGWRNNLSTLRASLKPNSSYLVLHSQEPKDVFDLRSAENFKRGMMSKGVAEMSGNTQGIGHVFLSWRCQVNGKAVEGTVGMTGELDDQVKKMMDAGWGLSAFIAHFTDGHLQTPELLDFEFKGEQPLHSLAIEVDTAICGNAMSFVKKFLYHKNEPYKKFGLGMDPAKFEGGGCGSFGVTVMNSSGIFGENKVTNNFWRTVQGRKSLFGYGLELPEDAQVKNLPSSGSKKVNKALLFIAKKWDPREDQLGQPIHIMDPEMLLLFFKTTYRAFADDIYRANGSMGEALKNSKLSQTRVATRSKVIAGILNAKKWIKKSTVSSPVNAKYDPQAAAVIANTRAWTNRLKSEGFRAHPVMVGPAEKASVGVILDRPE